MELMDGTRYETLKAGKVKGFTDKSHLKAKGLMD